MPRPPRILARLAFIVVLDAAALLLLSAVLPGFTVGGWKASIALALGIGLVNAFVWPALLRVALPFTVATLGLGALLVNAAFVVLLSEVVPDAEVAGLWQAVVVTLGMAGLTTVTAALFALDRGDLWLRHVIRKQAARTNLAVKSDVPGVLFLEIDGLARDVLLHAVRDGDAPTIARWLRDGSHRLEQWETHWSSQTGACQAGLLHGNDHDMPAFRWWEKERGAAIVTNHPKDAAELERRQSDGRGLLFSDGASRANILSGDAPHSMLTMSTVLNPRRGGGIGRDYYAYFASPYGVARTVLRVIKEIAIERWESGQQRRRDVYPRIARDWAYAVVRAYATVIQLDLQIAAVTADILAGRPVVYTTFLAYDEVAHHSGVERADTLAVLRRVDRAIARIVDAVPHAPRPYRVVILSDHGQSQGATFLQRYGETLEDVVRRYVAGDDVRAEDAGNDEGASSLNAGLTELATRAGAIGRFTRRVTKRKTVDGEVRLGEERPERPKPVPDVSVMASGNLGLITFPREPGRLTLEAIEAGRPGLVDALCDHPGVGFVLVRTEADGAVVLTAGGRRRLSDDAVEGIDPLEPYGPNTADHVRRTDGFAHCPDLMVQGRYWEDTDEVAAFEELVGSHGGLGGGQSHPFVVFPADLPWPDAMPVGADTVHRVFRRWLAQIGQDDYADQVPPGVSTVTSVDGQRSAT